jgi:purine-nucleoside phosphorylase
MITGNLKVFKALPDELIKETLFENALKVKSSNPRKTDLWTTDSLFCETYDFINSLKSINVEAIDMESSILFLLGTLYNIKVASILSVSDLPTTKFDFLKSNELDPKYEVGINHAIKILSDALPKISKL